VSSLHILGKVLYFHGDQKAVTLPTYGFDKAGFLSIIVECPADLSNRSI
jgi:hypothetical protein